jgi:hypothetical protein
MWDRSECMASTSFVLCDIDLQYISISRPMLSGRKVKVWLPWPHPTEDYVRVEGLDESPLDYYQAFPVLVETALDQSIK